MNTNLKNILIPKILGVKLIDFCNNNYPIEIDDDLFIHFDYYINYMFEKSWSKGGTYGNCYSDEIVYVPPDKEPELILFNQFLVINFNLKYEELIKLNTLICVDEKTEHDWYGGSITECIKYVDLNNLIKTIIDLNLVENKDWVIFFDLINILDLKIKGLNEINFKEII